MNINEVFNILNFWIAKERGSYFSISELEDVTHIGQLAFYNDMKAKYATSTLIKEILSPFKAFYDFTPTNTISGYIVIPSNVNYLDLLDIQITYTISNRTIYVPVALVNEDERADKLRSQVDPVTVTSPIAETTIPRFIRLYPVGTGYTGTVTFLTTPVKPVFAYTVISGRVIVYDSANSTQLQWRDTEITRVILKSLESIGINLTSNDIAQFSVAKTNDNYLGINHL